MSESSLPDAHALVLDEARRVVAGISEEHLDQPTPCADWDVRALLHHMVSGNFWVAPLVAGKTIEEVGDRFDGDVLGTDPLAAWDTASASAAAAFRTAGAMERPVAVSYGPVPGSVYCGNRLVDNLVHAWDLAVATGQDTTLDSELVEVAWGLFEPQADAWRSAGATGPAVEVPEDAPLQSRLLALLGRQP